jgi:hypothetical protein
MLTFRATWAGFFAKYYKQNRHPQFMTDANKLVSVIANNKSPIAPAITSAGNIFLDTAAELSKIDRKNHKQVSDKGVPLVYDLMVTVSSPKNKNLVNAANPDLLATGLVRTAPLNWQTRNAVRMAHFTREDLRKEAGVVKGSIGRYAKNLRLNLDPDMYNIPYDPTTALPATLPANQRMYAHSEVELALGTNNWSGRRFTGGVWDYTQLAQVKSGDADTANKFYLNVCDSHSSAAPGPYTYVGVLQSYNQRRQTTLDDSTLTSGGDTQFINNDSPFFRIPEQDVSEDAYVGVTLNEQDNPPYDRSIGPAATLADSKISQPAEFFQLTTYESKQSMRIQAPLGLVHFELRDLIGGTEAVEGTEPQFLVFEIECLGTYEM